MPRFICTYYWQSEIVTKITYYVNKVDDKLPSFSGLKYVGDTAAIADAPILSACRAC